MCLNKSAQPIKLIILFMAIGCQGNYVNSVSPAHQGAHGAEKSYLTKAQVCFFFNLSLNQTFHNNIYTHGSPFRHVCTEGKHCISFFFFSLKNYLACTEVNYKWVVTYSLDPLESSSTQAVPLVVLHALMLSEKNWRWNLFLKMSPYWHRVTRC